MYHKESQLASCCVATWYNRNSQNGEFSMSKRYYIVTANSSEPKINYSKKDNSLIFSNAHCRWDYAEKVSGCIDCKKQKIINDRPVFKIIESDFQHGKPNIIWKITLTFLLLLTNILIFAVYITTEFLNLDFFSPKISLWITNAINIEGLVMVIVSYPLKKFLNRFLAYGLVENRLYIMVNTLLISLILSAVLCKLNLKVDFILGCVGYFFSLILF